MVKTTSCISKKSITTGILSATFYILAAGQAHAAMAAVICAVYCIVVGDLGRAVASMGVLAVAIGASLGKVSWGLAITVAVGISLIFQAGAYAAFFGLGGGCPPCP